MTSSILTSQESLLCRLAQTTLQESSSLTAFQTTVDQLITRGAQELTNGQAVLAMMSGSLAYRAVRTSVLSLGSAGVGTSILLRPASVGLGLLGEVLSFEGVNRGLQGLGSSQVSANLWRWEGQGGWREGLLQSLITFSTLKLGGHFTQGQNWVLQQLGASTAMVAGHQAVYQLGFGERPEGDLAQQFVHAFVTNIELGLSMSLAGRFAPSLQALERSLDLSLHFSHSTNQTTTIFSERALFELSYAQNDMRQSQGISRPRPLLENIVLAMAAKETEVNIHTGLGEKVKAVIGNAPTIPEGELQAVSPSPPPVSRVVPSSSLIPAASLLHVSLGEKLGGRYEVVRHLGSGGFGDVYLVRDTNPDMGDRQLVVKIPREDRYSPDMARRVQREIRTSAKMDPRFTGIVYDSIKMQIQRPQDSGGWEAVDVLIPVMEYIPGHDLLTYRMAVTRDDTVYLEQHHLSRLEQRLDLFAKICEALASVHDRGYVHNDLKPENVRIHRDGDVRLMDFGQSKLASDALQKDTDDRDSDPPPAPMTDAERENYLSGLAQNPRVRYLLEQNITQPGRVSGTPGYIAPEKFLPSTQSDRRSDIFQMGIILFELISGVHPAAQYEINLSNEGPRLIPVRDQQGYTQMGQIASFLLQANPPPPLREVMVDQTSPFLNEIDAIARRAFAAKPEERFQTIREMRQAVLMVRAKVGFDRIRQTREEMKQIEAQMHAAWDEYRMDRQIDPELEERMHAPIVELTRRRQEIDQGAESLVTVLTPFADQGNQRASKMIAELSWMRLVHGGDLLAPEVRQILMQRIRQYDVETKDEPVESMRRALDEKVEVQLRGFDLYAQEAVSDFSVLAIEYQEDSPGFYREGNVVANFDISSQNPSPIRLKAGYYIFEIHHPQYGVMRVPYHLLLKEVRQSIIDQRPTSVQIDLAPSEAIPSDFFFVNGGRATLGHDIYRFEDPGLVISRPQRQEYFDSFAVSNPITVRQYQHFIEDRLNTVNELIAERKVREAFDLVEQIRDWVPRNPPSVPKRSFTPENVETLLNDAFNNIGLRWSITNIGFNGKRRYILNDPVEYGSPVSKHRILPNQSITSIPYNAAEAYTQWRAAQDGRPYRIISAREKEIISRNGFPWTYPWGYHFRRTALASRLVHRDLKNDAYSHPQGTHPLGSNYFRDFVAYGRYQGDGSLTRLVDLIGNDREWTSTVGEERTRVMSGGSVRSPSGNLFLPASTTYATERDWVAECNGAFRLVLPLPPSRRGR